MKDNQGFSGNFIEFIMLITFVSSAIGFGVYLERHREDIPQKTTYCKPVSVDYARVWGEAGVEVSYVCDNGTYTTKGIKGSYGLKDIKGFWRTY